MRLRHQISDVRPTYRHFERSEKSLSFAAWRSVFGNFKQETCYPITFGYRSIYIRNETATASLKAGDE